MANPTFSALLDLEADLCSTLDFVRASCLMAEHGHVEGLTQEEMGGLVRVLYEARDRANDLHDKWNTALEIGRRS